MGLPIWRDPEENVPKRDAGKKDPTAAARSSIRRRPSVHGRRSARPPLPRESSRRPADQTFPLLTSSTPREWRRSEQRLVPSVTTLLESADAPSSSNRLPHGGPDSIRDELHSLGAHERQLRSTMEELDREVRVLRRSTQSSRAGLTLPIDWAQWAAEDRQAWLDQYTARWTRSTSPTSSTTPLAPSSESGQQSRGSRPPRFALSQHPPQEREAGLPTPPRDVSDDTRRLSVPDPGDLMQRSHPLRRSWRAESPIDGLGDRIRSPTPADGWETMRATIAPDETLPSAESSFASAAASDSFNSRGTNSTDVERFSTSESSRRTSEEGENQSDSASSIDSDDLCNDEERQATASFAQDMYFFECEREEGRERIARHEAALAAEGNRYALFDESRFVELGFRMINEALDTPEGRARVFQLSQARPGPTPEHRNFEEWIFAHRRNSDRGSQSARVTHEELPSPHPERYGREANAAVDEVRGQVHDYFHRFTADALTGTDVTHPSSALNSPPPRYERLASRPDEPAIVSRNGPELHPVSPTGLRGRDVADALFSGDEPDLDGVRRIVERLAQREDIPDEWWTSVGLARHLNQSRTRVRSRSPDRSSMPSADGERVLAAGRIQRWNRSTRL